MINLYINEIKLQSSRKQTKRVVMCDKIIVLTSVKKSLIISLATNAYLALQTTTTLLLNIYRTSARMQRIYIRQQSRVNAESIRRVAFSLDWHINRKEICDQITLKTYLGDPLDLQTTDLTSLVAIEHRFHFWQHRDCRITTMCNRYAARMAPLHGRIILKW